MGFSHSGGADLGRPDPERRAVVYMTIIMYDSIMMHII
jgi:hypothetical protein